MTFLFKYFVSISIVVLVLASCSMQDKTINNQNIPEPYSGNLVSLSWASSKWVQQIASSWTNAIPHKKKIETEVSQYNIDRIDPNPILINDIQYNKVFLMSKSGEILHDWPMGEKKLWNDAYLLPDGRLLASLRAKNNFIMLGGQGGIMELIDVTWSVLWNYTLSEKDMIAHHDLEILPNGNILALVWDRLEAEWAKAIGYKLNVDIFLEKIIEINPKNNTIVWEWQSWDHLIQDISSKFPNYGNVTKSLEKIDINYSQSASGMVMHANGISYDPIRKLIYVSVYNFSEVWVIDHSTTTLEAATNMGGKYKKGWDLVYRFGNPSAYKGKGERLFYSAHYPNLIGSGKILIFSNGNGASSQESTAYELKLPEELENGQSTQKLPEVTWSYTHPELFFDKVGWVEKLPNGNILITEGDGTLWEVTREKELVWKYTQKPGFFWRAYSYAYDSDALKSLWITP